MYEIKKNASNRWVLLRQGSHIGTYASKAKAITVARLLGGLFIVKGK
jgi:hypothetical protein